MRTRNVSLVSLAALILAASARAGGIRILDAGLGYPSFATPQAAMDAAPEGAVLLFGAGTYPGFTLIGKSMSLFAMPDAVVTIQGFAQVGGLTASQAFVASGIQFVSDLAHEDSPAFVLFDSAGSLRFEACSFHAYDRGFGYCFLGGGEVHSGKDGVIVWACSRVVFRACSMTGGKGDSVDENDDSCVCGFGYGGTGLRVAGSSVSKVALFDCALTGGPGGGAEACQGSGGFGLALDYGSVFASGCSFQGGAGGPTWYPPPACGGPGGFGVGTGYGTSFRSVDSPSVGGFGDCGTSGDPYFGQRPIFLPGPAARATFPTSVITEQRPFSIAFQGGSLDDVVLVHGPRNPPVLTFGTRGPWLVKGDPYVPILEVGTADGAGALAFSLVTPTLPAGSGSLQTTLQVASSNAYGVTPGSSFHLLVLDSQSAPDCDGNGLNDFVELIQNPTLDANENLIPDACPGG